MNPILLKPYTIYKSHKTLFKKYLVCILKVGILKCSNNPKWGDMQFPKPKPKMSEYDS